MNYRLFLILAVLVSSSPVHAQEKVTNYEHGLFAVEEASALAISLRAVEDPYLRCFTAWVEDGAGGWINLYGADCGPEEWKGSHCTCPTVARQGTARIDLRNHVETPYTGAVLVAVSSYVGHWLVKVDSVASRNREVVWSTAGEPGEHHADISDLQIRIEGDRLIGEAVFTTWSDEGCPGCLHQVVLISNRQTGGLYDAVAIEMGIPGLYPGQSVRASFTLRYDGPDTRVWAYHALQYTGYDAVSIARQEFYRYSLEEEPIYTGQP